MRKPTIDAEDEILEGVADAREERIARRARLLKKARDVVAKFVRF